jgi:hypothetical protein
MSVQPKAQAKMKTANNLIHNWLLHSTPEQRERLAELAGTSVGCLNQWAGGYRSDDRSVNLTAEIAARLHKASKKFRRLPILDRVELAQCCRECEYAHACKRERKRKLNPA